jgi:hypothetical protein
MAGLCEGAVALVEDIHPLYEPSDVEVREYAAFLGMGPGDEPLWWIARRGLQQALLPPWQPFQVAETGQVFYGNAATGASQWAHPLDELNQELVRLHQAAAAEAEAGTVTISARAQILPNQNPLDRGATTVEAAAEDAAMAISDYAEEDDAAPAAVAASAAAMVMVSQRSERVAPAHIVSKARAPPWQANVPSSPNAPLKYISEGPPQRLLPPLRQGGGDHSDGDGDGSSRESYSIGAVSEDEGGDSRGGGDGGHTSRRGHGRGYGSSSRNRNRSSNSSSNSNSGAWEWRPKVLGPGLGSWLEALEVFGGAEEVQRSAGSAKAAVALALLEEQNAVHVPNAVGTIGGGGGGGVGG